ncbi:alpha-ketoacid dehydrogenase subunit beta [Streptomyces sp. WI03-4A]|uniref:alpha-ketoacid dehydrogenase subunit beta n=1 Tax=Streptomyces sp. WI03-4A TaxID=3028706 RepID=UPI0029BB40F4|nr:alpha-ketoacid dehydrogenase subunit beta [Streptomyces sp. WI03-4A]MDX2591368.1 alpha-ketoacid dehydrogenase subunit beta [Streptomyces sp. WI03-4A]
MTTETTAQITTAPATAPAVSMVTAINSALSDAMRDDERVVVFGEDVGHLGGVFRATDGLLAEFGEHRCFDTPICEAGILGAAIGMSFYGARTVVEMQFDAFAYPAFEQMVSHLAKMRNRTRGTLPAPVVVRIPYGGGIGAVEHHSDSSEAYAAHTPGLHVLTPATVADAYGMLRQAIDGADPALFFEPKRLYWETAPVDLPAEVEPIGRAVVRRTGTDATLITYGPALPIALAAADAAAADGYDLSVVDLRSLVPFDEDTVCEAVMRTGRAVMVHEASGFGGFGAEVAARVTERCFAYLEAPVRRVTGLDIPYPPPQLERFYLPTVARVLDAVAATFKDA